MVLVRSLNLTRRSATVYLLSLGIRYLSSRINGPLNRRAARNAFDAAAAGNNDAMSDGQVCAMTWNLWWRFGPHWQERQAAILATIEGVGPDVVALQEVWGSDDTTQAHELAAALGMHAAFAQPSYPAVPADSDAPGISLGVAILSRWPLHEQAVVALPARHR